MSKLLGRPATNLIAIILRSRNPQSNIMPPKSKKAKKPKKSKTVSAPAEEQYDIAVKVYGES